MPLIRGEAFAAQQKASIRLALLEEMDAERRQQFEIAKAAGRAEGFEAGLREARTSVAEAMASIAAVDASVEAELERTVLKLVVACLQKISRGDVHPETTRNIVRDAIRSSIVGAASVVFVSPDDLPLLSALVEEFGSLQLEVDRSLTPGEIVVASPLGRRRLGERDQIAALLRQLTSTADDV